MNPISVSVRQRIRTALTLGERVGLVFLLAGLSLSPAPSAASGPTAPPPRPALQVTNTCAITIPSGTAVTMGDGAITIPFTVTNTGNGQSIDTVQLGFDGNVYNLSRAIAPPSGWTISAIRYTGTVRVQFRTTTTPIPPGQSQTFYIPLVGASNGLFTSAATDQTDTLVSSRTTVSGGGVPFTCTRPSWPRRGLAVTVNPFPLSLTAGQTLQVRLTVTNRSSAAQSGITTTLTYTGTGGVSLTEGPVPGSLALAAGASASVVYTYTATANGYVAFTASATNAGVSSIPKTSDTIYIGNLTAALELYPTQVISGQTVTVRMLVQNNASPSAGLVTPSLTPSGTATVALVSGPSPSQINAIPPGSTGAFEWTFRITGQPGATFSFTGFATDQSGQTTNVATSPVGVIAQYIVIPNPNWVVAGSTNFVIGFTVYNYGSTSLNRVNFAIPRGWSVSATNSWASSGNWTKRYFANTRILRFSGGSIPVGGAVTFYIYFTAAPNPSSDTYYEFGTALYSSSGLQGNGTPAILVTRYRVTLTASPTSGIPADGASTSTITATVTLAGTPQSGVGVLFVTTAGTLSSASATTNAQGQAVVQLIAPISATPVTATVTGRYLTAQGTVTVPFTGWNDANPLYIGGTLSPITVQPGETVALSVGAINLGTRPLTLTTGTCIAFTDGTRFFTATLSSAITLPVGTARTLTFLPTILDPAFRPGFYYPVLYFAGQVTSTLRTFVRPVTDPIVVGSAALQTRLSATPAVVPVWQPIVVTMVVSNTGLLTATHIVPSALTPGGGGSASLSSGPTPSMVPTLAPGSAITFTWTYIAGSVGTVNWSGYAQAIDLASGQPISSPLTTSNDVTIVPAPALMASLSTPATVNQGQAITITLQVTNTNPISLNNVAPGPLVLGGSGSATYVSGPTPPSIPTLPGNSSAQFTWTYIAGTVGTVTWSVVVTGTDPGSGMPVTATATSATLIQTPAALVCTLAAGPTSVRVGETILVTMTVTNNGQATAVNVNPSALTTGGTGSAFLLSGPTGAPVHIPGGASAQFLWVYQATTPGNLLWSGQASGTDGNSGDPVSTSPCTSNEVTVVPEPRLTVSLIAQPEAVGPNGTIVVTMVVTNVGYAAALNVAPSPLTIDGDGGVAYLTGPVPASVPNLPTGGSATFVWTYRAISDGTVTWTGYATASNASPSEPATSNPVYIMTILIDKSASPVTIEPGGELTYTITIQNLSNKAANIVQIVDTLPNGFAYITTTRATAWPNSITWMTPTVTWDYSVSQPTIPKNGGVFTLTFTARVVTSEPNEYCNEVTLIHQGGTVDRTDMACVLVAYREYIITAQAGSRLIRARVRLVGGQPEIIYWEVLP